MTEGRVLSRSVLNDLIRHRQRLGLDRKDEVWEGVYVVMPEPTNLHQQIVSDLTDLFREVVPKANGSVMPGANVSDRREGWKKNFRAPDVVVVLRGGRAVDCNTHWLAGPDFLVEVRGPGDQTNAKIPFYAGIGVRELLVVHRDSRRIHLFRHDGGRLVPAGEEKWRGGMWVKSNVLPLAFRRGGSPGATPLLEVRRTDAHAGRWRV